MEPGIKISDQASRMTVQVICYASRKADERPVRFQLGEREHIVEEVLDQWYGPNETFFRVCADDGNLYVLEHSTAADKWTLESYRRLC
jgi:hypothetical protein